jgi:hypothetical protein
MTFTINLLSNAPFKTDSIFKGTKQRDNYVLDVRGFNKLVSAAKNYKFVDTFLNNSFVNEEKTTVEFIINETDKEINASTTENTKDIIIKCMDAFRPVIDEYAALLKNVSVEFFQEQHVDFNLVLSEMLNDSILKLCLPFTRMSKLFKYNDWIRDFINDILKYMISIRPNELCNSNGRYTKLISTAFLVERLEDETNGVYNVWKEFR